MLYLGLLSTLESILETSAVRRQQTYDYRVTCVIMGGGAGKRLLPLTAHRAKPAVPIGGKFRLIDVPISNCINSGINRIYVLTQFNSTSLHRHVSQSYHFHRFSRGFVEILAAQQTPLFTEAHSWYEGNADAVRKNLPRLEESRPDDVLILSGDQLYQMDFQEILATHRGIGRPRADATIAALLVPREAARSLGILRIDDQARVLEFVEKPGQNDRLFDGLEAPPEVLKKLSMPPSDEPLYLANMGIYAFRYDRLSELLRSETCDFGKEVLPQALKEGELRAHLFQGYWEDIGTIRAFHQANIDLATGAPHFDFYSQEQPVYTRARLLPASSLQSVSLQETLIADGCKIAQARVEKSLVGVRSIVGSDCELRNTFVMGNDYYETSEERDRSDGPPLGIGSGTVIANAIIDKNARVGRNVHLTNAAGHENHDTEHVIIRDGIIVVPRGGSVPDGYSI